MLKSQSYRGNYEKHKIVACWGIYRYTIGYKAVYTMKHKALIILAVIIIGIVNFVGTVPVSAGVDCAVLPQEICDATAGSSDVASTGIWKLLIWVLNIMLGLVGLLATVSIVYASVLYASAQGSSEQVAKAKKMIFNTVIGVIAFVLVYVALNWLVPGGVFT